jgi:hypothetical protein
MSRTVRLGSSWMIVFTRVLSKQWVDAITTWRLRREDDEWWRHQRSLFSLFSLFPSLSISDTLHFVISIFFMWYRRKYYILQTYNILRKELYERYSNMHSRSILISTSLLLDLLLFLDLQIWNKASASQPLCFFIEFFYHLLHCIRGIERFEIRNFWIMKF